MGRPTKLDDLTAKRIVDAIAAGVSRRSAAAGANVSYTTLKNWLATGRAGDDEKYTAFLARVEASEAKAERTMVDVLFEAARAGKFQAAQYWLNSRRALDWALHPEQDEDAAPDDDALGGDLDVARSVVAALESKRSGTDG